MPKKSSIVLAALLAAGAVVGVATLGRSRAAPQSQRVDERDRAATVVELRALQAQVALLSTRVAELQMTVSSRAGSPSPPASDPTPTNQPSASEPPTAEVAAADAQQWHELMARTEIDFQREARDGRWAADVGSELHAAIDQNSALRAAVQSQDCRSTTCRLEMTDDHSAEFSRQLQALALQVGPKLPTMMAEHLTRSDGTKATVYYFNRNP